MDIVDYFSKSKAFSCIPWKTSLVGGVPVEFSHDASGKENSPECNIFIRYVASLGLLGRILPNLLVNIFVLNYPGLQMEKEYNLISV